MGLKSWAGRESKGAADISQLIGVVSLIVKMSALINCHPQLHLGCDCQGGTFLQQMWHLEELFYYLFIFLKIRIEHFVMCLYPLFDSKTRVQGQHPWRQPDMSCTTKFKRNVFEWWNLQSWHRLRLNLCCLSFDYLSVRHIKIKRTCFHFHSSHKETCIKVISDPLMKDLNTNSCLPN